MFTGALYASLSPLKDTYFPVKVVLELHVLFLCPPGYDQSSFHPCHANADCSELFHTPCFL